MLWHLMASLLLHKNIWTSFLLNTLMQMLPEVVLHKQLRNLQLPYSQRRLDKSQCLPLVASNLRTHSLQRHRRFPRHMEHRLHLQVHMPHPPHQRRVILMHLLQAISLHNICERLLLHHLKATTRHSQTQSRLHPDPTINRLRYHHLQRLRT